MSYVIELTPAQINIIVAGLLELPGKAMLPVLRHIEESVEAIDRERATQPEGSPEPDGKS